MIVGIKLLHTAGHILEVKK